MRQKREFNSLRPYLLSILFLFYYGGIAIICWALWRVLNGFDVKSLFESKVLLFFIFAGFASGGLLFVTALQKFELAIRGYWNQRSGKGVLKALLYLVIQFFLFCLPFDLARHGYWFIQQLTPSVFLLGFGVTLIGITYSRYQGITCPGLSVCAQ
ncbi:TPA: hypothetical protein U2K26_002748 [Legionella pneumophila]|nr:hypothetical protein [Legionella pneumophila]